MRDISAALKERFAREDLSICRCVILKLKGGAVYYLTDLNRPIKVNGLTFKPEPNIDVSAIRTGKDTASQNAEIQLSYEENGLSERPIRFGLINDALCEIYWVDYRMPQLGGALMLAGKVAAVEQPRKSYCVLRVAAVSTTGNNLLVAEVYSKRCRNVFGDKRCKVNIDALSVPFTVVQTFPDAAQFAINGYADFLPPDGPDAPEPPRENGQYLEVRSGDWRFVVPNAQLLKLRMASSGGGGATSGGTLSRFNEGSLESPFGFGGTGAVHSNLQRLTRGFEVLLTLLGGGGGQPFAGVPNPVGLPDPPFAAYNQPSQSLEPGIVLASESTIKPSDLSYYNLRDNNPDKSKFVPPGGKGGFKTLPSTLVKVAYGGNGGDGAYIEYTFNLQDPNSKLKAGDEILLSMGKAGVSNAISPDRNPGTPGQQGFFELIWQSNVGEPILEKTFDLGSVLWTKGDNAGQINQIAGNTVGLITLTMNPRLPIDVGDEGLFRPGCSNFADMCENRWNNLINMQAEPVTPQGVTTAPSPIADTSKDLTKPEPIKQPVGNWGGSVPGGA